MKHTIVSHEKYIRSNGVRPRGNGFWAFHPNFNTRAKTEIFWAEGKFTDVRKKAVKHFTAKHVPHVEVINCFTVRAKSWLS